MEPWRGISSQIDRLFRLCQTLQNVAVIYVQARRSQSDNAFTLQDQSQETFSSLFNEFDMYLNQLHLRPQGTHELDIGQESGDMTGGNAALDLNSQTAILGEWFSGYMNMVGLSECSPSTWPQ
jgi:hypothetical protein